MSIIRSRSILLASLMGALFIIASGCDTLDTGDEGVIAEHAQEFRFETTAEDLADGVDITANAGLDVSSTLAGLGFAKSDIVSAEVVSAEISRVTPLSLSLDEILTSAAVRLSAGGSSATVAQATTMSSGTSTEMQVAGGNVASFARAPSAAVVLDPAAVDGLADGPYVFRVRLRVRLLLEGI